MNNSKCSYCNNNNFDVLSVAKGYQVVCFDCGARGPYCSSKFDAIEDWNRINIQNIDILKLRRSIDNLKIRSYELGQKELHDMALNILKSIINGE